MIRARAARLRGSGAGDKAAKPLQSASRYYWKVKVWDGADWEAEWSQPAYFEMGLLQAGDWQAQWIGGHARSVADPAAAPLLRREFVAGKPVASARLYWCGLGLGVLRLNGQPVDDAVLTPEHTTYNQRILYRVADVTRLIASGTNCLAAELGRGFYAVRERTPWAWERAGWRTPPKLLCRLQVRYADGTSACVVSDGAWQVCDEGPTTSDSIYWGEHYDARRERAGWDLPGYAGGGFSAARVLPAPEGVLRAQVSPPMRVVEVRRPVAVTRPKLGCYVFDMGFVTTGWIRFSAACPAGTKIGICYAERVNGDGTANRFTLNDTDGPCQTDSYIFKGQGVESWAPQFSYKGFRFVEISGCPVPLTEADVQLKIVHTDMRTTASFDCSNPMFNRLHENMVRTLQNNFHGKPTDTPTYEKNGWTGDANFALNAMFYNFEMTAFWTKWMDDCRDSMRADGTVPIIVPSGVWGYGWHPVWSTVYVYGLQVLADYAGACAPFTAHFEASRKYTDYNLALLRDGIATGRHRGGHELMCDHLAPGLEERSTGQGPPEGGALGSTAYLYGMLRIMAQQAAAHGQGELAGRYRTEAEKMRVAFNRHFLDAQAGVYHTDILEIADKKNPKKMVPVGYRQASNLIALAFDLAPVEVRERVVQNLVQDVVARGYHLDTGAAGTRHLLPVLTEAGHSDVAYRVATQTTYPSWGDQLALGATTMWECWRTPRSNNHYFMGTIDEWFFKHLAGLRDIQDGFRFFTVKPYPVGDLTHVRAQLQTVRGRVVSSWTRVPGKEFSLEVTVPVNASATVYVPEVKGHAVREGDQPAAQAPGVRFLREADGYAVYGVLSGNYRFSTAADAQAR